MKYSLYLVQIKDIKTDKAEPYKSTKPFTLGEPGEDGESRWRCIKTHNVRFAGPVTGNDLETLNPRSLVMCRNHLSTYV